MLQLKVHPKAAMFEREDEPVGETNVSIFFRIRSEGQDDWVVAGLNIQIPAILKNLDVSLKLVK